VITSLSRGGHLQTAPSRTISVSNADRGIAFRGERPPRDWFKVGARRRDPRALAWPRRRRKPAAGDHRKCEPERAKRLHLTVRVTRLDAARRCHSPIAARADACHVNNTCCCATILPTFSPRSRASSVAARGRSRRALRLQIARRHDTQNVTVDRGSPRHSEQARAPAP
jgi:hypothetical protein